MNIEETLRGCAAKPPKTSASWWMNDDQYDAQACHCVLWQGHDGDHKCSHTTWAGEFASH